MIKVTDEMRHVMIDAIVDRNATIEPDTAITRIIELHEASKPKPEPFCFTGSDTRDHGLFKWVAATITRESDDRFNVPLYTQPPTREPLSERVTDEIRDSVIVETGGWISYTQFNAIVKAVEKAYGIGV